MIEGWDPPTPDGYLSYRIATAIEQVSNASVNNQLGGGDRIELDSHANMCVLGKHCLSLSELETAQTVNVCDFSESDEGLNNVPIVDAVLVYDFERTKNVMCWF